MSIQETDAAVIQNEKQIIKDIIGLSSTDEVILNDRGWDSRVYSFENGRYFFKFPRSDEVRSGYKYEIAAIKFIGDMNTKVVAQKILWEHSENNYFGYEGVQGRPLSGVMESLSVAQKRLVGEALGDFLKQFHALDLPGARTLGLEDESKQIQRWYEDSKLVIEKLFTNEERQRLHSLVYDEWPARLIDFGSELVLCHGDLHFDNILYGNDGSMGIIDFGDVAYWDRSKDFLELMDEPNISKATLEVYGAQDANFQQKVEVRQAMIQIINLGFFASKDDAANVGRTLKKLKAVL